MTRLLPIDDCKQCYHSKLATIPYRLVCTEETIKFKDLELNEAGTAYPPPYWCPLEKKDGE